ncbi:acetylornithine/succinylornithine family transaminase [Alkalihalobacillus sp. MEB130]|uniref:aspartate aminotransferase family protein n=1 Tax=Alkalihalobacillus sp. MEB130 TaxID=2976704 RepID=UPI0028DF2982|nr:acetylornithine/succinylornithine family transaminase [Alkalihalobacillus sp. MEB130]MDT8859204.1 acetylornithine/succinylornithine family transaminase [Alkalihalobacillus sp. MEB130]
MSNWIERDKEVIMSTYGRLPIVIDRGEGNYLYDENGKKYLDLFTGLAVNILGHSHPIVAKALEEQASKFLHVSNYFYNKPAITLAEKLINHSIKGKVFFANSGAEATEAALKLIHKWSKEQKEERSGVVVLEKSFHGRTLGALKLTRQKGVYQDFPVTDTPVYEVEPHNVQALKDLYETKKPAAIILEPILGSGGIVTLEEEYLQSVSKLCKEYGVLCCMDEIQTGVGRTGAFFAYQHAQIKPDVILFAKGIGGGLPLGGIIVAEQYSHLFKPGDHGTTFGPSPLSAALGNAVIDVLMEKEQLRAGTQIADQLHKAVKELQRKFPDAILDVRGKGMMLGIVMNLEAAVVKEIQHQLLNEGIMVDVTQQTIIRLLPPLTLTSEEVRTFIEAFEEKLLSKSKVDSNVIS